MVNRWRITAILRLGKWIVLRYFVEIIPVRDLCAIHRREERIRGGAERIVREKHSIVLSPFRWLDYLGRMFLIVTSVGSINAGTPLPC